MPISVPVFSTIVARDWLHVFNNPKGNSAVEQIHVAIATKMLAGDLPETHPAFHPGWIERAQVPAELRAAAVATIGRRRPLVTSAA